MVAELEERLSQVEETGTIRSEIKLRKKRQQTCLTSSTALLKNSLSPLSIQRDVLRSLHKSPETRNPDMFPLGQQFKLSGILDRRHSTHIALN